MLDAFRKIGMGYLKLRVALNDNIFSNSSKGLGQPTNQPANQPASQPASQPVSQPPDKIVRGLFEFGRYTLVWVTDMLDAGNTQLG